MSFFSKLTISRRRWTSNNNNSKKISAKKRSFTRKKGMIGCLRLMRKINSSKTRNSRLRERTRIIRKRLKVCKLKQTKKAKLLGRSKRGSPKDLKNRESWPIRLKLLLKKLSFREFKTWLRSRNNFSWKKKRWEKGKMKIKGRLINRFRKLKMIIIKNLPNSKQNFSNKKRYCLKRGMKARSLHCRKKMTF